MKRSGISKIQDLHLNPYLRVVASHVRHPILATSGNMLVARRTGEKSTDSRTHGFVSAASSDSKHVRFDVTRASLPEMSSSSKTASDALIARRVSGNAYNFGTSKHKECDNFLQLGTLSCHVCFSLGIGPHVKKLAYNASSC